MVAYITISHQARSNSMLNELPCGIHNDNIVACKINAIYCNSRFINKHQSNNKIIGIEQNENHFAKSWYQSIYDKFFGRFRSNDADNGRDDRGEDENSLNPITAEQLEQMFPNASAVDRDMIAKEINANAPEFKLDTRIRQRHFFSQIKGETGDSLEGETEGWNYSPEALKRFSSYYRDNPKEADQDGYLKDPTTGSFIRRADERAIGRKHFQRLNGNRASNPEDGYNFRGRGLIQITGYEKYNGFMQNYAKYWDDEVPDTVNNPERINEVLYAIRSAMYFWLQYKVYLAADQGNGYADVKAVTRRVNGGSEGLDRRSAAYKEAEGIFR